MRRHTIGRANLPMIARERHAGMPNAQARHRQVRRRTYQAERKNACACTRGNRWKNVASMTMNAACLPAPTKLDIAAKTARADFFRPCSINAQKTGIAMTLFLACCAGSKDHAICRFAMAQFAIALTQLTMIWTAMASIAPTTATI